MQKSSTDSPIENIRHSLAHLLAAAVLKKFPKAKLGVGPVIENGFYYDFLLPHSLTPEDLKEFEKTMRELIHAKLDFTGKKITPVEAKKLFERQKFPQMPLRSRKLPVPTGRVTKKIPNSSAFMASRSRRRKNSKNIFGSWR